MCILVLESIYVTEYLHWISEIKSAHLIIMTLS